MLECFQDKSVGRGFRKKACDEPCLCGNDFKLRLISAPTMIDNLMRSYFPPRISA
jgi:hypothetical protein